MATALMSMEPLIPQAVNLMDDDTQIQETSTINNSNTSLAPVIEPTGDKEADNAKPNGVENDKSEIAALRETINKADGKNLAANQTPAPELILEGTDKGTGEATSNSSLGEKATTTTARPRLLQTENKPLPTVPEGSILRDVGSRELPAPAISPPTLASPSHSVVSKQTRDMDAHSLASTSMDILEDLLREQQMSYKDVDPNLTDYVPVPPDGGYGWVIVAAAFMCNLICDALLYAYGLLLPAFQEKYNVGKAMMAFPGGLICAVCCFVGPFVGGLVNRYGTRAVCLSGAVIAAVGVFLSSFAPTLIWFTITFSFIAGAGLGMVFMPVLIAVGFYFERKRALATGIAVAGSGVGTIITGPLCVFLLNAYGLRGTLWMFSGFLFNCCVFALLLRPLKPARNPAELKSVNLTTEDKLRAALSRISDIDDADAEGEGYAEWAETLAKHRAVRDTSLSELSIVTPSVVGRSRQSLANVAASITDVFHTDETSSHVRDKRPSLGARDMHKLMRIRNAVSECQHDGSQQLGTRALLTSPLGGRSPDEQRKADEKSLAASSHNTLTHAGLRSRPAPAAKRTVSRTSVSSTSTQPHHNSMLIRASGRATPSSSRPQTTLVDYARSLSRLQSATNGLQFAQSIASVSQIDPVEFARPLYRKDIFYGASVEKLNEFKQSYNNIALYRQSQISIPHSIMAVEDCTDQEQILDDYEREQECVVGGIYVPDSFVKIVREMIDISLLTDPIMIMLGVSNVLGFLAFYTPYLFLVPRAVQLGVSESNAAFLMSILGLFNTVGRVFFGWFADRQVTTALNINNISLFIVGALNLLLALICDSYPLMVVYSIGFGFVIVGATTVGGRFIGAIQKISSYSVKSTKFFFAWFAASFICLTSIVLVELMGLQLLTNAYGLLCLFRGVGLMVGSPLAGLVYDLTSSYNMTFIYSSLLFVSCATCSCGIELLRKRRMGGEQYATVEEDLEQPLRAGDVDGNCVDAGVESTDFDVMEAIVEENEDQTTASRHPSGNVTVRKNDTAQTLLSLDDNQ